MSDFFDSLRSDLLDRRLTPVLALLGAALLGAIVYALLAGGSSSTPSATSSPAPTHIAPGIAVTALTSGKTAVAETTNGTSEQTVGHSRNPFAPLPGVKAKTASTTATTGASGSSSAGAANGSSTNASSGSAGSSEPSSSSTGGSTGGSESSSSQSGGTQPEQKKNSKPSKSYKVSVLFGTATAGMPVTTAGLPSYENLKRQQPLPSATQPLIVFRGVVAGGKSATFTLVGEVIPRGNGLCQPSASQCQAIDVKVGETEELEYVPLGGAPVNYALQVVKIEAVNPKAAGAASVAIADDAFVGESKAGLRILREAGLLSLPWLRYSTDGSVLVFKHHAKGLSARAHVSARGTAVGG